MSKLRLIHLKINISERKLLLNMLLIILKPNNKIIVMLSQNLDKYIVEFYKKNYWILVQ